LNYIILYYYIILYFLFIYQENLTLSTFNSLLTFLNKCRPSLYSNTFVKSNAITHYNLQLFLQQFISATKEAISHLLMIKGTILCVLPFLNLSTRLLYTNAN